METSEHYFFNTKKTCPICQIEFTTNEMCFSSCSHIFCIKCTIKLKTKKCPICRQDMYTCIIYERKGERVYYKTISVGIGYIVAAPRPQDPSLDRCYACVKMKNCDCYSTNVYHLFHGDEENFYKAFE